MIKHFPQLQKLFKKANKINFDKRYKITREWEVAFAKFVLDHPSFKDRSKFI